MTAAELVAAALERHGVTDVFAQSMPSKAMLAAEARGIRQIGYRTEHAGGAMADGYARASNRVGVVGCQNGPAAAEAHHATGAPVAVHLELGTAALDVLDLLCGRLEVPPQRVVLGHLNRSPDPRMHRDVARAGAFIAFDGPSRANHTTDWRLLDSIAALVDAGHADQLLLGADTTTARARASTGEGPGMPFLLRGLRPRIERELGADIATKLLVDNPARAFAAERAEVRATTPAR